MNVNCTQNSFYTQLLQVINFPLSYCPRVRQPFDCADMS